jgi:hypothetical protein
MPLYDERGAAIDAAKFAFLHWGAWMQRVLSNDLWTEVRRRARASKSRKAAIAYATRDLVGFRNGDKLVVDASVLAIRNGETDAKLLRKLHKEGVQLYDCVDLHAKILVLDDVAIIGSGNMSSSSELRMVEAALISNQDSVVAGVASLIEQVIKQSTRLTGKRIAELCKIEVVRRGGWKGGSRKTRATRIPKLGNRTWIVGVHEVNQDPKPQEQKLIDDAIRSLQERVGVDDDDITWIRWGVRGRFARECRGGDLLIQIWRSSTAKRPSEVLKAAPVLLKQRTRNWTRFYVAEPLGRAPKMTWGQFKRLLGDVGYPRQVKAGSVQVVDSHLADAITRKWYSAARH